MSIENSQKMDGSAQPFKDMQGPNRDFDRIMFINSDIPDEDTQDLRDKDKILDRLNLNIYSTADEARQKAFEFRDKYQNLLKNGGLGGMENLARDLFFVLYKTGDIVSMAEVDEFLRTRESLREIELTRSIR